MTSLQNHQLLTMTTVANLLARKQQLLDRLQDDPGPHERDEIERILAEINEALNVLDKGGPGKMIDEA